MRLIAQLALAALLAIAALDAEVTCERKSQITGGTAARLVRGMPGGDDLLAGASETIYILGNKMLRTSEEIDELIDLDKQTVTAVRHDKKTYSVTSFDVYRAKLEGAAKSTSDAEPDPRGFDVRVKETSSTRTFHGLDTKGMSITVIIPPPASAKPDTKPLQFRMDLWIAPDVPGSAEASEFYGKLSEKLGPGAELHGLPPMRPAMRQGMLRLMQEMHKLKGLVVEQGTTVTGPAGAGFDMDAARQVAKKEAVHQAGQTALRGMGRFGSAIAGGVLQSGPAGNIPPPDKTPVPGINGQPQKAPQTVDLHGGSLLELTMTTTDFNNAPLAESKFSVPDGYSEVSDAAGKH